jgi:glutathione S-transferase
VSEEAVRADLAALGGHLARVDRWVEEGVLGGETPNAGDLQVGASLALLRAVGDLAPQIDASRGGELVRRWFGDYPGAIPAGALAA